MIESKHKPITTTGSTEPYVPGSFLAKRLTATSTGNTTTASIFATFDKSILQVTDWLLAEKDMLKKQVVTVADIDGILIAIEKQKVS